MIRVVLDTNVFVSAILSPEGQPARILELALEGRMKVVVSPSIVREIWQVFQYQKIKRLLKKRKLTPLEVEDAILKILKVAFLTLDQLHLEGITSDPADDMVICCAVEGQAHFIISGDKALTDLNSYQGIQIIEPAAFLQLIADLR